MYIHLEYLHCLLISFNCKCQLISASKSSVIATAKSLYISFEHGLPVVKVRTLQDVFF